MTNAMRQPAGGNCDQIVKRPPILHLTAMKEIFGSAQSQGQGGRRQERAERAYGEAPQCMLSICGADGENGWQGGPAPNDDRDSLRFVRKDFASFVIAKRALLPTHLGEVSGDAASALPASVSRQLPPPIDIDRKS